MSRIGKNPITIVNGVKVDINGKIVQITGPFGTLKHKMPEGLSANLEGNTLTVNRNSEDARTRSLHGLNRTLVNNMVLGVSTKFKKELQIIGVGYKILMRGKSIINFVLGYSHPIDYLLPEGISASIEGNNKLIIEGMDKHLVGEVASQIKRMRPVEPYKGKGIRYLNEVVRKKAGKTAAGSGK